VTGTELARLAPTYAELDRLRDVIAPGADDAELGLFARVCAELGLSPFKDQIALVPRYSNKARRDVHKAQIMVAGRRTLAERTGELRGIDGPEWTGPRDARGNLAWSELWTGDGYPYAARVFVYRAEWVKPANGTVKWSEFAPTKSDGSGKLLGLWPQMPSHMLGKTAESLALRRAFPDVINADVLEPFEDADDVGPAGTVADRPAEAELAAAIAEVPGGVDAYVPATSRALKLTQSEAHAVVGSLAADRRAAFLEAQGIADFGEVWPVAALEAAAELASEPF
jgi:hypothetical protein